jgi:hypothetical protein
VIIINDAGIILKRLGIVWLAAAVIITGIFATIYGVVQQNWRMGANFLPARMAQDVAHKVQDGSDLKNLGLSEANLDWSQDPFVIVYAANGAELNSSGKLNGKTPSLPVGVFDEVKAEGQDRFTWQPDGSHRFAAVVTTINSGGRLTGYGLAAQSLKEVEEQEERLTKVGLFTGAGCSLRVN